MHRFLKFQPLGNVRVALRADGSVWLIANPGAAFELNRGGGWQGAVRQQLCEKDRVRIEGKEVPLVELSGQVGVKPLMDAAEIQDKPVPESIIPGVESPRPLFAPARVVDNARRNPGTGQVEAGKENS